MQTHHVSRSIIASKGILAHKKSKNKYVEFTVDSITVFGVEVGENKLSTGVFSRNGRNSNHENENT